MAHPFETEESLLHSARRSESGSRSSLQAYRGRSGHTKPRLPSGPSSHSPSRLSWARRNKGPDQPPARSHARWRHGHVARF